MQHHYLHYSIFIKKEEEAEENIVFNRKIREIIRWRLPFIMKKKKLRRAYALYMTCLLISIIDIHLSL